MSRCISWFGRISLIAAMLSLGACGGGGSSGDPAVEPAPPPSSGSSSGGTDPNDSSGSGSDGDIQDQDPPAVAITFPHLDGLWVEGTRATVRGTASDDSEIKSIIVNGVHAFSDDGYKTWQVTVPVLGKKVSGKLNVFHIEAEDVHGNRGEFDSPRTLRSHVSSHEFICGNLSYDRAGNRLFHYYHEVIELDLDSGEKTYLGDVGNYLHAYDYSPVTGKLYRTNGLELHQFSPGDYNEDVVVSRNGQSGIYFSFMGSPIPDDVKPSVFVMAYPPGGSDEYDISLYEIDLYTGERHLISGPEMGGGLPLNEFGVISVSMGRIFVTSDDVAEPVRMVLEIDRETGDRTVISGDDVGGGYPLNFPVAFNVDERAEKAYVADLYNELIEVDIATGDRRLVSGDGQARSSNLVFTAWPGIASDAEKSVVYVSSCTTNQLIAVDIATGERSQVTEPLRGEGPTMNSIRDMQFDAGRRRIVVANQLSQVHNIQFMSVDPVTGDREIISETDQGEDLGLSVFMSNLTIDEISGDIYTLNLSMKGGSVVVRVNPDSGEREIFLPGSSGENLISSPESIDLDSEKRRLYAADGKLQAVISVDLSTGEEVVVSQPGVRGQGETWASVSKLVLSADKSEAYVVDPSTRVLYRVDLNSGDREILSSDFVGENSALNYLGSMNLDPTRSKLVFGDGGSYSPVIFVDLETGKKEERYFSANVKSHDNSVVDPKTGYIYLSHFSNQISVYDYDSKQAFTLSQ